MRIEVNNFNGSDVRVSLEAETVAEQYQLRAIREKLEEERANFNTWQDTEGRSGICLIVGVWR